jgi:hypothetical protein
LRERRAVSMIGAARGVGGDEIQPKFIATLRAITA